MTVFKRETLPTLTIIVIVVKKDRTEIGTTAIASFNTFGFHNNNGNMCRPEKNSASIIMSNKKLPNIGSPYFFSNLRLLEKIVYF